MPAWLARAADQSPRLATSDAPSLIAPKAQCPIICYRLSTLIIFTGVIFIRSGLTAAAEGIIFIFEDTV
jgi:hypothetical protein